MEGFEETLPPLAREKLAEVGEITLEEKQRMRELEELELLLSKFYKNYLNLEDLWKELQEYEQQGKYFLLREAEKRLKDSFKGRSLRLKFEEKPNGRVAVELLKEDELTKEVPLILELTDSSFDEAVKKHKLLVVDCWAPWCAPCRMVAPIMEELARDYKGRITFGRLNVDDNPLVARKYHIMSIPTLLVFKGGVLIDQKVGAMPRRMLEPALTKHL